MSVTRVAPRYAKSLIDLAAEQNKLERVLEDIERFKEAAKNRDLYLLIKSPIINTTKKVQIFKQLFAEDFDELSMAFFNIILNKKRESFLIGIADEFIRQYRSLKEISTVKLVTATPIGESTLAGIKEKLLASTATGRHVEIVSSVDPSIIGGFVLEFDSQRYDASVAHKLETLKKEFTKNDFVKSF
ncbi:MAG: ATP synthase F1 subunit delta [Bacteroidota bacterium]